MFLCSSSFLVRIAQELEEKEKKVILQVVTLLNLFPTQLKHGKVGYGSVPLSLSPLSFKKRKKAISVLRGMICSSLSLEKPAIKMEKYISVT